MEILLSKRNEFLKVNTLTSGGATPVLLAACCGTLETFKTIMQDGSLEDVDKYGYNVLHQAAWSGNSDVMQYLCDEHRHLLNTTDSDGDTALHVSVWNGKPDCINILLKAGCRTDIKNNAGKTARDWAHVRGYTEIVQLIDDWQQNNST